MRKGLRAYIVFLTILILGINEKVFGQSVNTVGCDCDYVVQPDEEYIDGSLIAVGPGDVVCVAASNKRFLGFINFKGAPDNPIIFKNCGGQVVIRDTEWYYGIKFDNCSYFRLTGTGSPAHTYGFLVDGTPHGVAGVGIAKLSTDFEIDHVEVSRTGFAGIVAKSDPDCTGLPNRGNFVQYNTSIHHNYVHDTFGEGIYVGFPHYSGVKKLCGADSVQLLPHDIIGLKIFKNVTNNTGKEGVQVGCAVSDVEIYENSISNFGRNNGRHQRAGVHLSTGTTGKFYSNSIHTGSGSGIWLNGRGDNHIFNNLIIRAGSSGEDGIMIHDSLVVEGMPYNIINNTIVYSGGYGMKVYTNRRTVLNFRNNIVTGWGSDHMFVPGGLIFNGANNVTEADPNQIRFEDIGGNNFRLRQGSPAVDAGEDMSLFGVMNDFENTLRPLGKAYDAGAFESPFERRYAGYFVYPNPVYLSHINEVNPADNEAIVYIRFILEEDAVGSLKVFDTLGRVVAIISEGPFEEMEEYKFEFNSVFLRPGMYYYVLEANDERQVKKIIQIE